MNKDNQKNMAPDVYALIRKARMSDRERQVAVDAMRIAGAFADAVLWVKDKAGALGTYFLKPSLKH